MTQDQQELLEAEKAWQTEVNVVLRRTGEVLAKLADRLLKLESSPNPLTVRWDRGLDDLLQVGRDMANLVDKAYRQGRMGADEIRASSRWWEAIKKLEEKNDGPARP